MAEVMTIGPGAEDKDNVSKTDKRYDGMVEGWELIDGKWKPPKTPRQRRIKPRVPRKRAA